jgi:hypothetical protein
MSERTLTADEINSTEKFLQTLATAGGVSHAALIAALEPIDEHLAWCAEVRRVGLYQAINDRVRAAVYGEAA